MNDSDTIPRLIVVGPVDGTELRGGSNGHQAAARWRSRSKVPNIQKLELKFVDRNTDLIPALQEAARGSYAMVPIENGNGGFVPETIASWIDLEKRVTSIYRPRIVAATVFPVVHCLLVHQTVKKLSELEFICSHPQAIEQSKGNIEKLRRMGFAGSLRTVNSTAEAAFRSSCDPHWGSLASPFAAEIHGLKVLRKSMQDSPINDTRFQVVTMTTCYHSSTKKCRTAILVRLNDSVGSLTKAFDSISSNGGMVKGLQSFPEGKLGKMGLYIEYEMLTDRDMLAGDRILTALRRNAKSIFELGAYPIE